MRRTFTILSLLLSLGATATAAEDIGVLYIERTFEGSELVKRIQADLKGKAEQVGATIEQINGQLEELQAEMESTPESAPAHHQAKEQFEVLKLRRKLFIERSQEVLRGEEVRQLKASYLRIRDEIKAFAEDRGLSLVLMAPLPEIRAGGLQELNLELATHNVLYHQPQMDITKDFTAFLNQRTPEADQPGEGEDAGTDEATAPVIDLGVEGQD